MSFSGNLIFLLQTLPLLPFLKTFVASAFPFYFPVDLYSDSDQVISFLWDGCVWCLAAWTVICVCVCVQMLCSGFGKFPSACVSSLSPLVRVFVSVERNRRTCSPAGVEHAALRAERRLLQPHTHTHLTHTITDTHSEQTPSLGLKGQVSSEFKI